MNKMLLISLDVPGLSSKRHKMALAAIQSKLENVMLATSRFYFWTRK